MPKVKKEESTQATTETVKGAPSLNKFKVKRNITLPLVKPQIDQPVYVKITDPMKIGKQVGDMDAAMICNCIDLQTGEAAQIILPSVLQGIFHDDFGAPLYGAKEKGEPTTMLEPPHDDQIADAYVGLGFMITKHTKASGKKYNPYSVAELDLSVAELNLEE